MLANVLGMLIGFTLGVVIRNSAGAIVGVLRLHAACCPPCPGCWPRTPAWFSDAQPWVDFNFAQSDLFNGDMAASTGPISGSPA